ncbi:flippase [Enterobacter cloacae]|uniref:flippase n=1 Tax=Enterobacter cloacae TaxID=550 RepID=UPI000D38A48E|nr:flippase [Enterobacter cloacae]QCC91557.1 flippase [Enterobacter cloacae]QCC96557.1 flippase [Enterobacter cloacae]QCD11508.1 flippase [Enterobacter cloacae]
MTVLKNSYWNILAIIVPTVVAIPALGILARLLGVELFGVFTLMFAFLGYASLFDMGLSRALVRSISINRDNPVNIKEFLFVTSIFVTIVALFIGVFIYLFRFKIIEIFNVTPNVQIDVLECLKYVAISVPFLLLNIVWQSYLEGLERFKELSILKVMTNVILSIIPVIFVYIHNSIAMAIGGLVIGRIVSFIIFFVYAYRTLFAINKTSFNYFNTTKLKELFKFGGWLTISNLISPMMVYFDRFVLSSGTGAASAAMYTAPAEIISKMLMIPGAISKSIFPKLSNEMDKKIARYSFLLMVVVAVAMATPLFIASSWVLQIWLGKGYEAASITLKILLVGFVFNSLAQIPYTCIQAKGYSKITAKLHMAEILPYFGLLYVLISHFSYNGAAVAWTIRVIIDFSILSILYKKVV